MARFRQNFKTKLAFSLLLPYVILVLTASFLHVHPTQAIERTSAMALSMHIGENADRLFTAAQNGRHDSDCPACTWLGASTSVIHCISHPVTVGTVSRLEQAAAPNYHLDLLLHSSSRAPPLG